MLAIDLSALSEAVKDALGINLTTMAIQILATIVLVVIVRYFFWNKITDYLQKRREFIANEIESAKQQNADALILQEAAKQESLELKLRTKEVIASATQKGEEERQAILEKAKAEAQRIILESHQATELEKEKTRVALRDEVIDLATLMAEKIIQAEIDDSKYKDLTISDFEGNEEV